MEFDHLRFTLRGFRWFQAVVASSMMVVACHRVPVTLSHHGTHLALRLSLRYCLQVIKLHLLSFKRRLLLSTRTLAWLNAHLDDLTHPLSQIWLKDLAPLLVNFGG